MSALVDQPTDVSLMTQPKKSFALARLWIGLRSVGALLSVGVALASYRYVIDIGPVPPNIRANNFVYPWIIIHAGAAATALLCGGIQLQTKLLRRWPACHRWLGRAYVAGCLIGGAAGLVLSAGVSAGPAAKAGFAVLGALWVYVTVQGWRSARAGRWVEHGRWMIRSFALAFGAVTLRLYLPTALVLGFSFPDAYRVVAWLAWVPNAMIAELYLNRTSAPEQVRTPPLRRSPLTATV